MGSSRHFFDSSIDSGGSFILSVCLLFDALLEWPQVLGLDDRVKGGDFHPERQPGAEAGEALSLAHVEGELAVGRMSVCPAAVAHVSLK